MGQFDQIKKEESVGVNIENTENLPNEVESIVVPNAEEIKVKEEAKAQQKIEDDKKIEEIRSELMGGLENKFGVARIDNPKILDLIAEIEFGATIKDEGVREQSIQTWMRNVQAQYNDAIKELSRKRPGESLIYGRGGKDRFQVTPGGEVVLIDNEGANLIATPESKQRAIELGMKVSK